MGRLPLAAHQLLEQLHPSLKRPREKIFLSKSSADKCYSDDGINIFPILEALKRAGEYMPI